MTDMTTDLVKRLEAGETGREIDAEVFRHFGYTIKMIEGFGGGKFLAYPPDGPERCEPARLAVSTSLDAAVALVERVIPKCEWSIDKFDGDPVAHVDHPNDPHGMLGRRAQAPTPAAALVAALLKAKGAGDV